VGRTARWRVPRHEPLEQAGCALAGIGRGERLLALDIRAAPQGVRVAAELARHEAE
jgi:hypothetical protein